MTAHLHPSSWILSESQRLRYGVFFLLYVMQGLPAGFALTALANYLAAEGVSTEAIGNFVALVGLPWGLKFVWGPVVDRYTYRPMGHRRPWILGAQLMALLTLTGVLSVDDPVAQFTLLGAAFCAHGVFASLQDVAVDALAIEVVPEEERGRTNAFMRGGFVAGTSLGAAGLGYLLRYGGFHWAALTEAGLLFILTLSLFFVRERRGDRWWPGRSRVTAASRPRATPSFRALFRQWRAGVLARSSLLLMAAVSLVYISESLFRRVLDVHLIQNLGWTDVALSGLRGTAGTTITLVGVFVGGWLVDRVGGRRVLIGTVVAIGLLVTSYSLAAPHWSSSGFTSGYILVKLTLDTLINVAAIPLFMNLCRPGVEGSQFVFYMALSNQTDILGASLAGTAVAWLSVPEVGYLSAAAVVVALFLVKLTPLSVSSSFNFS